MGTVGDITLTPKDFTPCMSNRALAIVRNIQGISPQFLFAYFLTSFANDTIERLKNGGVQQRINLDVLGQINIPLMDYKLQSVIESIVLSAQDNYEKSKLSYSIANNIFRMSLEIENWNPTVSNSNEKTFQESFINTGRLDADYYQYKFDELIDIIKNNSEYYRQINEIRTDNYRGLQPVYIQNGGLKVINSKHILEDNLDYANFEETSEFYWDEFERARVFHGDILTYTTGANIGRTNSYLSNERALASNHVNILRLHTENPCYVGFVMNSIVGRLQTEKYSSGSAQAELYPRDIDQFLIPFIKKEKQEEIEVLVNESLRLKNLSISLLEIAKLTVEKAIETNENTAIQYTENILAELDININDLKNAE